MPENMQFGWELFTLSPVANVTVDSKKVVRDLFHAGRKRMYQEKTRLSQ